ncbi:MAG: hypothetical protein ABJB74_17690, partial [Gemmatimonas sp.]
QSVLRQVDSVVVKEKAGAFLGKLGAVALGKQNQLYVAELLDARVLEIAPDGTIAGTFGQKGNGPGELATPGYMTTMGDSLFVNDQSQRRVSVFNTTTRKFVRNFSTKLPIRRLIANGSELLALSIDPKTFSPVAVLSPTGEIIRTEGVMPDFLHQNSVFASTSSSFPVVARGDDMWGANEYTQSILRWKRGTSVTVEELKLPVVRRWGVDLETYRQILRDPNDPKVPTLIYKHSFPAELTFVATDILGLLTFDPTFKDMQFTGPHHLTLIDIKNKKVCPDIPVPIPTDPQPKVVLKGDMLVVLQQMGDKSGEIVSAIRRFKIDPKQCVWKSL